MNLIQKKTKKQKNKKKTKQDFSFVKNDFVSFSPCSVSFFIIFPERNYFYGKHYIDTK